MMWRVPATPLWNCLAAYGARRRLIDLSDVTYYVGHETVVPSDSGKGPPRWLEALFAAMQRNSVHVSDYFKLPQDTVVEIGREINLMAKRLDLPMSDVDWPALWAESQATDNKQLEVAERIVYLDGPLGFCRTEHLKAYCRRATDHQGAS